MPLPAVLSCFFVQKIIRIGNIFVPLQDFCAVPVLSVTAGCVKSIR